MATMFDLLQPLVWDDHPSQNGDDDDDAGEDPVGARSTSEHEDSDSDDVCDEEEEEEDDDDDGAAKDSSLAILVVDAAYAHISNARGKSTQRETCVNAWSREELEAFEPLTLRRRVEAELGRRLTHCVWCGARDGRRDSGGAHFEHALRVAGFETRWRRIKVDEVYCRARDCGCRHATEPVLARRQSGVDVDVAARTLELALTAPHHARCSVVLLAGDGDFAPLAEILLRRPRCDFRVAAFERSLSPDLADLANLSSGVLKLDRSYFHHDPHYAYSPGYDDRDARASARKKRGPNQSRTARRGGGGGGGGGGFASIRAEDASSSSSLTKRLLEHDRDEEENNKDPLQGSSSDCSTPETSEAETSEAPPSSSTSSELPVANEELLDAPPPPTENPAATITTSPSHLFVPAHVARLLSSRQSSSSASLASAGALPTTPLLPTPKRPPSDAAADDDDDDDDDDEIILFSPTATAVFSK